MKRVFLFLFLTACTMDAARSMASAQKLTAVSLSVTIETTLQDQVTPTQITPDSGGAYIDGAQGVTAKLSDTGDINILFWPSRGTPSRNVYFNHTYINGDFYSGPLPGSPFPGGQIPPTGAGDNPHLSAQTPTPALATPYVAIQNMVVGSAQCIQLYWAWGYRDLFHFGLANTSNTPTEFAVVSRDSTDQWTLSTPPPGFGCSENANESETLVVHDVTVKNQTVTVQDGYFYVPFRLTLRRNQ